jgi:predicted HicB family RNase H-like nuclease
MGPLHRLSDQLAVRMKYKNYTATIEYDHETEWFIGRVNNVADVITFYGKSVNALQLNFAASVEAHLASYAEQGLPPPEPIN